MSSSAERHQAFLDGVRSFNKHVFNKFTLALAESGRGPFSILCHSGRRSGCDFRTPVLATYVGDSVIIPLSYGRSVDWLQNVLAQKSCTIIHKKQTFSAGSPEILPAAAALKVMPPERARLFARFKLVEFVRMTLVSGISTP
jgi:deazaflavin-dependent oxidoreductase (nitroreductase family)